MDQLTIQYMNGNEEKYQIVHKQHIDKAMRMQYFKQVIENNMLKLVIDDEQIQLIPLSQIRKIIIKPYDTPYNSEDMFTGFLNVTIEKSPFTSYHDLQ